VGGSISEAGRSGSAGGRLAPLKISLPVDPSALCGARRALDDWLAGAGVSRRDVEDVLIAANEACMNAVEHSGTPPTEAIRVLARADRGRLWLEVRDSGRWREPTEHRDRGHGLNLMRALTDALAVEREDGGTTVFMEKALSFGDAPQVPRADEAELTTEWIGDVCVTRLSGDVDLAGVESIEARIDAATSERPGGLVVDLSGVGYLDSAGVHMLFRLARNRRTVGAATSIVAAPGPVRRVLELTDMETTVPLAASVASAVEALGKRSP
jgi:anti-anti-sigma factor